LAKAGQDGANVDGLRSIGLRAETAMLPITGGINTPRAAIFGLGLFCAAAGAVAETSTGRLHRCGSARRQAALHCGNPARLDPSFSHSAAALRRVGAGAEAATRFGSVHEVR
jgi:triphosphoribosyl-dephospho-CoA synthase